MIIRKKKIDTICLCKDSNIFLFIPCHDVQKLMPSLYNHRILRGSKMLKSQTKLSNLQTVTSILLVTSHNTMGRYCETCYENKDEKTDETCLCQDCKVFLCTRCYDVYKECHLCKITELYVEHGCQNHRLSSQIYRLLPPYCLSLAATLWTAIVRLVMIIMT